MVYSNTTVQKIELTTSIWSTKASERLKNKKKLKFLYLYYINLYLY